MEGKSVKKSILPREWGKALKVFRVRCSENNPLALPPLQTLCQLQVTPELVVTPRTTKTVIIAKTIFVISAKNMRQVLVKNLAQ